jgi:hypothetical protein
MSSLVRRLVRGLVRVLSPLAGAAALVLLPACTRHASRTPRDRRAPVVAAPAVLLDHVWLVVAPGAPERAALEGAGLRLAPGVNRHDGQGTASITVELENAFVELIWADSTVPVAPGLEGLQQSFRRRADWRATGWSPIGLGFRRPPGATDSLPVPSRPVRAAWMPPGAELRLLTGAADSLAPRLWVVPAVMGVRDAAGEDSVRRGEGGWATLRHPLGVRRLTGATVRVPPAGTTPPAARLLDSLGAARFAPGDAWLLELTFDDGRRGRARDLRPTLPLLLRY